MAQVVQPSDFVSGRTRIPNAVSGNAGEGANADLVAIIAESEKDVLLRALGQTQYNTFQAQLDGTPASPWTDLRDFVKPILVQYIYCQWLRHDEVNYTTVGGGKGKAQGQVMADLNGKYVKAWNVFVRMYSEGIEDWETSLYDFLKETSGLSEASFQFAYQYENQFGL